MRTSSAARRLAASILAFLAAFGLAWAAGEGPEPSRWTVSTYR